MDLDHMSVSTPPTVVRPQGTHAIIKLLLISPVSLDLTSREGVKTLGIRWHQDVHKYHVLDLNII